MLPTRATNGCQRLPARVFDARNGAWSFADLAGRHAGAVWPAARSVLEEEWNAVGRLLLERTGRQRQRRISAARRRRAYYCQTSGRPLGHQRPEEMGLLGDRVGS